jgi:uncharacterized protein YdcH (DUF465 family)
MDKTLPIFDIVLNDNDLSQGVAMISLVDEPAIGVDWIKLSKHLKLEFSADKDKQMLYGPFLIPNMLIYRRNEELGEFYIRFSKEEIAKIASKFNSDLNNNNINFMHTDKRVEAFVAENWIIEGESDKSKNFGFDLPEGTWFGGVKIKDTKFWTEMVKTEEVKGFSVEILADSQLALKNIKNKMEKEIKLTEGSIDLADADNKEKPADDPNELTADPTDTTPSLTAQEVSLMIDARFAELMNEITTLKNASLTAQEVSLMIDARFAELMNEITSLKNDLSNSTSKEEEYKKEIETLKSQVVAVEEKLSTTPAAASIKKPHPVKYISDFEKQVERIKMFKEGR